MTQINSQEQTIYRNLLSRIQLGFYQNGERFPSVKELAGWHKVSYCPAQRALKALERDGLILLCRGKETVVLGKPYEDYLSSSVFCRRADAIMDLCKSLRLISKPVCLQGILHMDKNAIAERTDGKEEPTVLSRSMYRMFEQTIRSLGSQTILSLYYDVGSFVESTFVDLLYNIPEEEINTSLVKNVVEALQESLADCCGQNCTAGEKRLEKTNELFFAEIERRLERYCGKTDPTNREVFAWEPYKGRTKYCDVIAIDLVCKINQGIYPVDTFLPNGAALADIYHVSGITIRRTLTLLNRLGVARTMNGIGTRVISSGDSSLPHKLKSLKIDSNLKSFLEALQFFAITGEEVLRYSLCHCPQECLDIIGSALEIEMQKASMVGVLSACLQAVVRFCPLNGIREIYSKITLLLLNGSILRVAESGQEQVPGWESIAGNLRGSLREKNMPRFAEEFRHMLEKFFLITRQTLSEIGVDGVEMVADPFF